MTGGLVSGPQPRFGIELRFLVVLALAGAAAIALLDAAVYRWVGRDRIPVEQRLLEAERDALRSYLAAIDTAEGSRASDGAPPPPDTGAPRSVARAVLPFADVLVGIRASLIEDLIDGALPIDREVAGRYRIRIDSARVSLRPGLALVELSGRARLSRNESVFADVWLLGALEIGTALDDGSALGADISILGVRTRDVGLGPLSPPAERLVDELARLRLGELDRLLRQIPIPVRLDELVELPAVEEEEVTIPAASLGIGVRLDGVRVLEHGVFVSLAVTRTPGAGPARPDSVAPGAPIVKDAP